LRAGFAADAAARVEINDSVRAREKRRHRTNLDARRIRAVIAAHHGKQSARVRETPFFDVFNPRAINADWNFVFGFTSDGAGVTADAFAIINDKTKIHNVSRLRLLRRQFFFNSNLNICPRITRMDAN
jgi:hypothetical protein